MKSKVFEWTSRLYRCPGILAVSTGALAANPKHKTFSGVINAYTPQPSTGAGPYEVRGPWSLSWDCESGKADFFAALNMEFSDGWVLTTGKMNFDPNGRGAHTHHISLSRCRGHADRERISDNRVGHVYAQWGPAPATIEPSPW